jgi:hypothetical protein
MWLVELSNLIAELSYHFAGVIARWGKRDCYWDPGDYGSMDANTRPVSVIPDGRLRATFKCYGQNSVSNFKKTPEASNMKSILYRRGYKRNRFDHY